MAIKTFLFDLDGTLLPMDEKKFETYYFTSLHQACGDVMDIKQLVASIWQATKSMVLNTEYKTNETVFFDEFRQIIGTDAFEAIEPVIANYYSQGFDATRAATWTSKAMQESVALLKQKGYSCRIATNPMFPKEAIEKRIAWTGIDRSFFDSVTYFEESHYCKPQIEYYKEIMAVNHLEGEECMMVGNNALEDLIAAKIGVTTYLVTNCLLSDEKALTPDYSSDDTGFLSFVKAL